MVSIRVLAIDEEADTKREKYQDNQNAGANGD
jgi:hypothetical protein